MSMLVGQFLPVDIIHVLRGGINAINGWGPIPRGVCHGCAYSSDAQKVAVFGGHAMIPLSLQAEISAECGDFSGDESEKCSELVGSIRDFTGEGLPIVRPEDDGVAWPDPR